MGKKRKNLGHGNYKKQQNFTPKSEKVKNDMNGLEVKGLINLGNTCYFNSMLQMILNCPNFMRSLKDYCSSEQKLRFYENSKIVELDLKVEDVSQVEMELINLYKFGGNSASPADLRKALLKEALFKIHFGNNQEHDSHEAFLAVLNIIKEAQIRRIKGAILDKYGFRNSANVSVTEEDKQKLKSVMKKLERQTLIHRFFGTCNAAVYTCNLCNTSKCVIEDVFHVAPIFEPDFSSDKSSKKCDNGLDDSHNNVDKQDNNGSVNNGGDNRTGKKLSKHQLKKQKRMERKANRNKKRQVQNDNSQEIAVEADVEPDNFVQEEKNDDDNDELLKDERTTNCEIGDSVVGSEELNVENGDINNSTKLISNDHILKDIVGVKRRCDAVSLKRFIYDESYDGSTGSGTGGVGNKDKDESFDVMRELMMPTLAEEEEEEEEMSGDTGQNKQNSSDRAEVNSNSSTCLSALDDSSCYLSDNADCDNGLCAAAAAAAENELNLLQNTVLSNGSSNSSLLDSNSGQDESVEVSIRNDKSEMEQLDCAIATETGQHLKLATISEEADNDGECLPNGQAHITDNDNSRTSPQISAQNSTVEILTDNEECDNNDGIITNNYFGRSSFDDDDDDQDTKENCNDINNIGEQYSNTSNQRLQNVYRALLESQMDKLYSVGQGKCKFETNTDVEAAFARLSEPINLDAVVCDQIVLDSKVKKKCEGQPKRPHVRQDMVLRPPLVLPVYLNRFRYHVQHRGGKARSSGARLNKDRTYYSYPLVLDISSQCSTFASKRHKPILYQLFGLIEHQGGSIDSGHYISFVRRNNVTHNFDIDADLLTISTDIIGNLLTEYETQQQQQQQQQHQYRSLDEELVEQEEDAEEKEEVIDKTNNNNYTWYKISDNQVSKVTESDVLSRQAFMLFYFRYQ